MEIKDRSNRIVFWILVVWLGIAFLFWTFFLITQEIVHQLFYYYVVIFVFGTLLYWKWNYIQTVLQGWQLPDTVKFITLGYLVILAEEVLAGFFSHLSEGFDPALVLVRILQFQFINIVIFTGFIFVWAFLIKRYQYNTIELFVLAGIYGLYGERIFSAIIAGNLMGAFLFGPLVIFVYGIIILYPTLSIKNRGTKNINRWKKYFITLGLLLLASLPFVLLVSVLRESYPFLFPPAHLIPI